MNLAALAAMVTEDAAFRRRRTLQPVGGAGDKIFPPTYPGEGRNAGPRHVYERRKIAGAEVWCVLVDSVQSQANRLEESLLAVARDGAAPVPRVEVDFTAAALEGITTISSLDAPDTATFQALEALGRDVSHVGHSASLRRRRVLADERLPDFAPRPAAIGVYRGRFDELVEDPAQGRRLRPTSASPPTSPRRS